ncbi:MAG: acetyl-CoA carboxylase biotin carboxylase subunit [Deltaproteobacteria bacterium]|nr:acetyl-CoA carboxylase biotin carboxylase subunit [Deltaproteobacteria bacterium]
MFHKLLIANRGEIAVRIMRTCREMGIRSVAVYSEADRNAAHVRYADEAHCIGPSPAGQSYLSIDAIIEAATRSGAEAIHPGYGFLAENVEFARRVGAGGMVFIGPKPETIALLGDKTEARRCMKKAGVPLVPGIESCIRSVQQAKKTAESFGYPILIKAAAGGGGKGMRVVYSPSELAGLLKLARSEALNAFGDDRVYLEKYLQAPRHIEVQILADQKGHIVQLGERECSIQRRHQKVIEESPSPTVDARLRRRMGEAAVEAAKSADYTNAGTVEFLLDRDKNFYFLEVNTRLQVEHPITEMVTGLDLVREQIRIAAGESLRINSSDIVPRGSAIECRIYAEDPDSDFLPSSGTIRTYREPNGPFTRVDSGYRVKDTISLFYDPLIAKLISWGRDRGQAIERMRRALDEYVIMGITTTIGFHRRVMAHPRFVAGDLSTHFIVEEMASLSATAQLSEEALEELAVLACTHRFLTEQKERCALNPVTKNNSNWKYITRYRNVFGN